MAIFVSLSERVSISFLDMALNRDGTQTLLLPELCLAGVESLRAPVCGNTKTICSTLRGKNSRNIFIGSPAEQFLFDFILDKRNSAADSPSLTTEERAGG